MAMRGKSIRLNSADSGLCNLNDRALEIVIRDYIEEAIVTQRKFYDLDDIARAIDTIYPVIAGIVFNPEFIYVRRDTKLFTKLVNTLVKLLV